MRGRAVALRGVVLASLLLAALALPGAPVAPVRAAEYTLETSATYDVQPEERKVAVTVDVTFTNTTPDPAGQFSVFDEVKLAIQDQATGVVPSDGEGDLTAAVAVEQEVNVATIALRAPLRFEETAEFQVSYTLPDTEDPLLRVRPSLVVFPAWSFGTSGEVTVTVPEGYEVHADGDPLRSRAAGLMSGPIADPSQWLALVTAVAEAEYATLEAAVPLQGGTADLRVRSFADDVAWGDRTLALAQRALPILGEEIGLPYPRLGELVLTEDIALNASGIGERADAAGAEILIAFDEPPFTTLHQLAHIWLSEELVGSRWIREGLASEVAERVAARVEVPLPYDPAAVATEQAASAFPLDSWSADAEEAEAYGYAASWSVMVDLRNRIGVDAIRTVLTRVATSVGPYHSSDIAPLPPGEDAPAPAVPLTTRSFLDHLETVAGMDLTDIFRARVLTEADVALLDGRAAARAAFNELVAASGGWGAPDPVAGAMTAWSFDDAATQITATRAWLVERESLVALLAPAGLSAPSRLQEAYRAHGGGADAQAELNAEREVAESYIATADAVNAERSLVERIGLIGGPDPAQKVRLANGLFTDGDLRGSLDAIREAQQLLASAEAAGIARLASAALIAIVLLVAAGLLFRRRASYTSRR
ncbi:MAG: hypothetical protein ACXWWL_03415 [Candidatus Limnocylindria bacterium]